MDVQRQDVVDAFPELEKIPAGPQWAYALKRAKEMVAGRFDTESAYAVMLYTAHLLWTSRTIASGRGSLTSEAVGGVSRGYAALSSVSTGGLRSSPYGEQFYALANQYGGTPLLSA